LPDRSSPRNSRTAQLLLRGFEPSWLRSKAGLKARTTIAGYIQRPA
jgi:hypothetical protein